MNFLKGLFLHWHLFSFLMAKTREAKEHILEQHPELLDEDANAILTRMLATNSEVFGPSSEALQVLAAHQQLIHRTKVMRLFARNPKPEELQKILDGRPDLREAFDAMMPRVPIQGVSLVPPQFRDDFERATATDFVRTDNLDLQELSHAVSLCKKITNHPGFSSSHESFRHDVILLVTNLLAMRYLMTGDSIDLDESILILSESIKTMPILSPDRSKEILCLACWFELRYLRSRNISDLNHEIELIEQAMKAEGIDSGDHLFSKETTLTKYPIGIGYFQFGEGFRLETAGILATALHSRYLSNGNPADLNRAIELCKQSIEEQKDAEIACVFLNMLASFLNSRYRATSTPDDLEDAIQFAEKAITLSKIPSLLSSLLNTLGTSFYLRYKRIGDPSSWQQARDALKQSCELGSSFKTQQDLLQTSQLWAELAMARQEWTEAVQALDYGIAAIDMLTQIQLQQSTKQEWLRHAQALVSEAAFANTKCGNLRDAILALELGRTRLLVENQERRRSDVQTLAQLGHKELFRRYQFTSEQIQRAQTIGLSHDVRLAKADSVDKHRALRSELDNVIAEIKQVPGYEDFLSSPDADEIGEILTCPFSDSEGSTVGVYLIAAQAGGLALIVRSDEIEPVWLDFDKTSLDRVLVRTKGKIVEGGFLIGQLGLIPPDRELDDVLNYLGDHIIQPIVATLGKNRDSRNPRELNLMLIPTGRMGLLPLHAARFQANGLSRCLVDEFTVAYTPSARVLKNSHKTLKTVSTEAPSFIGIGNPLPLPEKTNQLVFAKPEIEEISQLFGRRARRLSDTGATHAAVVQSLDQSTYLHFSCHGYFNLQDPLMSGLMLSNGEQLTIAELSARDQLTKTRLVVLSACQTAITDFNQLPEEAVGLPAGFLQVGVPGVIGTLWPVNDMSTALLMIKFYEFHLKGDDSSGKGPMHPAAALRKAQLWLRNVTNSELSELFSEFKATAFDTQTRMVYATAQEKFREHTLAEPDTKPFEHPYYWAAFAFYGA